MLISRVRIPSLVATFRRYVDDAALWLGDVEIGEVRACVDDFLSHTGPLLQRSLVIQSQGRSGKAWLGSLWSEHYWQRRDPLATSTNYTIEMKDRAFLDDESDAVILGRLIHAYAILHCANAAGRRTYPPNEKDAPQCDLLRGGSRVAAESSDRYSLNPRFAKARRAAVLIGEYCFMVPMMTDDDVPLGVEEVIAFVDTVLQFAAEALAGKEANLPFVAISCLSSDKAVQAERALCAHAPENRTTLMAIRQAVVAISVIDGDRDEAADMLNAAYGVVCWSQKPLSFIYNSTTRRLYCHCEHSRHDGAATLTVLNAMADISLLSWHADKDAEKSAVKGAEKSVVKDAAKDADNDADKEADKEADKDVKSDVHRHAGSALPVWTAPLQWQLSPSLRDELQQEMQEYREQMSDLRYRRLEVPVRVIQLAGVTILDAFIQFALQYAQYKLYGNIEPVYASTDISHSLYGRTECVRPVTPQSVALIEAVCGDTLLGQCRGLYAMAEAEHRRRMCQSKSMFGADRHLFGLHAIAQRVGISHPLFDSALFQRRFACRVSTSCLDDPLIERLIFSPNVASGWGIAYRQSPSGIVFDICYASAMEPWFDPLCACLQEGIGMMYRIVCPGLQRFSIR